MTQSIDVAARFDRISEVYDETREPLTYDGVDRLAAHFSKDGSKCLLEVGVGTGRIAGPLQGQGFDIVGADLSRGMLEKARTKGMKNLFMADADNLPFPPRAFDAVLMAHVIHLLGDPAGTFWRVAQVARNQVAIIFRKRDASAQPGDGRGIVWQAFRNAAEGMGYTLPHPGRDWRARFKKESEFLAGHPPNETVTIQDVPVVATVGELVEAFEKRAYGFSSDIPDEIFRSVMQKVRTSLDAGTEIRYRRVEQLGVWRLPQGR